MGRISIAFRAFLAALFDGAQRQQIKAVLDGLTLPAVNAGEKPLREERLVEPQQPVRSDAISLLAALQREGRFVDLVKQPLANFSDEEIGAAARNVLNDCRAVIERFATVSPVAEQQEGADCDVPAGYDPACFKLTGRVEGAGPFRGKVVHHGWRADGLNLPVWTGSKDAALVIAPAEIEVQ